MNTDSAPVPLFLEANGRRLFAVHHPPGGGASGDGARGAVLLLPPFAEEMNMSRRMLYLLGRALAADGCHCLLPDLTGTGESDGDFSDARWETWAGDARSARDWLADRAGCPVVPLGLRAGALLAAGLEAPPRLILWQPVGNGQTMLNQFLRIRVAGGLTGGEDGREKETTAQLRAEWAAGRPVEIAGYEVHPELAAALDAQRLDALAPAAGTRVDWIETGDAASGPSPATARIVETWRAAGVDVRPHVCAGDPFWTIQETAFAPAMIEATLAALADDGADVS